MDVHWDLVGCLSRASWRLSGLVLEPSGVSFGPLGASWGLLGASWGVLEASWSGRLGFSVRGFPLGPLLGLSWGPLGPSWAPFGLSWGPLGRSWGSLGGLLGRLGVVLGASWAVLERRKGEKARKPNTFKNLRKSMILASWGSLGKGRGSVGGVWAASWAVVGPSWAAWDDQSGTRDPFGPSGRSLEAVLSTSWAVLGASGISDRHRPGLGRDLAGTWPGTCRVGTPRGRPARAN